jgi:hypothetical protein
LSPVAAWIDMPTSLMRSSRFWAVTTSSRTVLGATSAALLAWAGAAGAAGCAAWA